MLAAKIKPDLTGDDAWCIGDYFFLRSATRPARVISCLSLKMLRKKHSLTAKMKKTLSRCRRTFTSNRYLSKAVPLEYVLDPPLRRRLVDLHAGVGLVDTITVAKFKLAKSAPVNSGTALLNR